MIVGSGGAAIPLELGEPLASWVLDPDLDKYRRMDPRAIVNTALDTIAGGVPDDIRADYLDSYDGDRYVESMRYVRRYPEELPELAALLPRIATPVTIINGRHDPVVPLANAEFLDERLPNSRLAVIDAGHFVWEEAPEEYAAVILGLKGASELASGPDSELGEHVAQVPLDGAWAEEQAGADLRVREPVAGELGDLSLLRR